MGQGIGGEREGGRERRRERASRVGKVNLYTDMNELIHICISIHLYIWMNEYISLIKTNKSRQKVFICLFLEYIHFTFGE